jgi:uncharacterized protein (DUF488 family)
VIIATIGHTGTTAEHFFGRLSGAGIERLLDIRLRPASQFATFAHQRDLPFFLRELCGIEYEHDVRLAPTPELLDAYRAKRLDPVAFATAYRELVSTRDIPAALDPAAFERKTALLCSEPTAAQCHRGVLATILAQAWHCDIEHL